MDEFEFVKDLTAVMSDDASRRLGHLEDTDPYSPVYAMRALRDAEEPLSARARLRQEFTLGQRMALADMIRTVCSPHSPLAGTPERMIDMLVGD